MLFIAAPRKYFRRLSRRKSLKVHRLGKIIYVFLDYMRFFADGRQSGVNKRPRGVRVQLCGRCGPAGQSEDGGDGARPLRPAGGYARLACASPDRGLRTSVGLSSRKGKQKFAARWEKDQICSRTTMVLGQGACGEGPSDGRAFPARARLSPAFFAKGKMLSRR